MQAQDERVGERQRSCYSGNGSGDLGSKSYVWYPVTQWQFSTSTLTTFYTTHSQNLPLSVPLCVSPSLPCTHTFMLFLLEQQTLLYNTCRELRRHPVIVLNFVCVCVCVAMVTLIPETQRGSVCVRGNVCGVHTVDWGWGEYRVSLLPVCVSELCDIVNTLLPRTPVCLLLFPHSTYTPASTRVHMASSLWCVIHITWAAALLRA